jgi:hypothetical protein
VRISPFLHKRGFYFPRKISVPASALSCSKSPCHLVCFTCPPVGFILYLLSIPHRNSCVFPRINLFSSCYHCSIP